MVRSVSSLPPISSNQRLSELSAKGQSEVALRFTDSLSLQFKTRLLENIFNGVEVWGIPGPMNIRPFIL